MDKVMRNQDAHPPERRCRRCRRLMAFAVSVIAFALLISVYPMRAQMQASEYQIKAAYLFDFSKFVKWPADSPATRSSSFEICILGQDPFGATLDATVTGEKLDGLPVMVRRLEDVAESKTCRVIFISRSEEPRLSAILDAIDASDSLTVSDIPHFSKRGGMIEFVPEGSRVRFGINLDSALRSRLTVSSELLKVAASVVTSAHLGGEL